MKRGIVETGNKADCQVHQYFPQHKKVWATRVSFKQGLLQQCGDKVCKLYLYSQPLVSLRNTKQGRGVTYFQLDEFGFPAPAGCCSCKSVPAPASYFSSHHSFSFRTCSSSPC